MQSGLTKPPVARYFGVIDAEQQRAMRGIEFARHYDVLDFRVPTPHVSHVFRCALHLACDVGRRCRRRSHNGGAASANFLHCTRPQQIFCIAASVL